MSTIEDSYETPAGTAVVLGSGPAGTATAAELARRGWAVRLVDRRGGGPAIPGVERAAADATDVAQTTEVTRDASVIVHAVNVAYHLQVEVMPKVTTAVLAAAEASAARLVVLDTLYPYGDQHGEHLTEETPWSATTRKGRLRADLDRRYLEAHASGAVRCSAGRSADFYGPGVLNSTMGGAVFPGALTGTEVLAIGDIDLPHSYTFIEDVARGLATLAEQPAGDGRIWHLPTVPARSTREVLGLVERAVGRPLTLHTLHAAEPWGPFDATFMDEYAEMFYQHRIPQRVVSTAFETTFGVSPTPFEEGIPATVDWYRDFLRTAG